MNKNMPLVSIVVPCYNHEMYVEQTIESIVNQTYKNIELIVIDDGSKDNSVEVIKRLREKYDFIFIYRENKGLSATLNEGIKLSKGKYFSACASDDKLVLDKIEKQVNFMESNNQYAMCYGNYIMFTDDGKEKNIDVKNPKSGFIFDRLIMGNFIPAVTQMIRKDVFNDVGLFDESLYIEDWDMWLRISNKYQVGYLDAYLAYYRKHETNISHQTLKMYESKKLILNKWKYYSNYENALLKNKLIWFCDFSRTNKQEAKKYLKIAFKNIYRLCVLKGLIRYFFTNKSRKTIK